MGMSATGALCATHHPSVQLLLARLRGEAASTDATLDPLLFLIENLPDHLLVLTPDGEILYCNSTDADHALPLSGDHIDNRIHRAEIPRVHAALAECVATAQPVEYEVALSSRYTGSRWGSARLVPVCGDGQVQCVILYGRDITAERYKDDQLRVSQQRLAMVFQTTPLAAMIVDTELRVREWNPAAEKLFGYSRAQVLGRPLIDLVIPEQHRAAVHERFVSAFSGRYGFSRSRNINIDRHGKLITCNWFNTPLYDEYGNIDAMAALGQDITHQIHAEEALTEAMRAAEASARAKSQFLANMSHEIRTPMHGILGVSELLLRQPLGPELQADVTLIHQSATTLLSVVDDILVFSKLEADTIRLHPAVVDIADLLHDTVELLRPLAEKKQLQYSFSQQGEGRCVVRTDPVRVRQVVNNLVGNAIKFTERGFVHVEHRWSQRDNFIHLQIVVRDTGPGIAPEHSQAIFDDFYQGDASWTRSHGGTGLGLAISRRLAELMGGSISVSSEVGQGSCFTFDLCAESAQPLASVVEPSGQDPLSAKVLLVDDNPVNLAVGAKLLLHVGLEVDVARNGYQALGMAHRKQYDIIFMDIQMPDLDGLATCRQLRAEGCLTPVIAITADALPEDRDRCLDAGMQAILTKPFRTADIRMALQPYLGASIAGVTEPGPV